MKRSFKLPIVLCAAFAVAASSWAGELTVTSPNKIVTETLDHNYPLKVSAQNVNVYDARHRQAKAQAYQTLDVKAQAARYQGLEDATLGPQTTIEAVEDRYSASIGITQPLYTGGRISNQKRGAFSRKSAAEQSLDATKADTVLAALTTYWNWSKAHYLVQSLEAAVERTEAHAVDMRNQHEAGMVTDNDLLATEVQLDQTRLLLEDARNRVALSRSKIEFLTGNPLSESAVPEEAVVPADMATPGTNSEVHRPEMIAGALDVEATEAQQQSTKSDFYPQLSLSARYEQANPNVMDFPLADEWKYDAFAGVTLSWNLLDWGLTRAKAAEAAAQTEQARLRLKQLEEQITLEIREARINLQDASSRVTVTDRACKSAERNLQAATDLWESGLARHSDVLDAMASNRPYWPALGVPVALEELARHRGTAFDADAVDAAREAVTAGDVTY